MIAEERAGRGHGAQGHSATGSGAPPETPAPDAPPCGDEVYWYVRHSTQGPLRALRNGTFLISCRRTRFASREAADRAIDLFFHPHPRAAWSARDFRIVRVTRRKVTP